MTKMKMLCERKRDEKDVEVFKKVLDICADYTTVYGRGSAYGFAPAETYGNDCG